MVPSTLLSIILFILLIAPGLLFDLLAGRRRVGAPESAFRETSRVVLASLAFSTLGLLAVALLRTAAPHLMPDPRQLFGHPQAYFAAHYRRIFWAMALEAVVAVGSAAVIHSRLQRKSDSVLRTTSSWSKVLREDLPAGAHPHVRVRLTNGTVYVGQVSDFTADLDQADREIVLCPPLYSKSGDKALTGMPEEWQRVVLPASSIESIGVTYKRQAPS